MNWVGGWRSRVMKSGDTRKQKEFFEKKRMQNRHNLSAPPPPVTPKKGNVGNMDLLTMFIVEQIALKKEHAGNHKKTHLPKSKGIDKYMSGQSLELPMSPCSPSRLSLAESKSHYSEQTLGLKQRKHSLLDEFKFNTLSPLLETNLSDAGTSVCQHRVPGSVGSISSASPSSSEAFNLQSRPTVHNSPLPPTELYSTKSLQPVGMCEYNPQWTEPFQTEAPQTRFADGVQFGSVLHRSESSGPSIYSVENPFSDLKMNDREEKPHLFGFNSGLEGRIHRIASEHACDLPVTCNRREGCVTSDDATSSAPYILEEGKNQDGHNYMCHSNDILTTSQTRRVMSFNQKVMCDYEHRERESKAYGISKALRRTNHKHYCEEDQFVPSCLLTNTQSGKTPRTHDKATQTADFSSLTSQDASVQCCLLKAARMSIFTKPTFHIHHSRTHKAPATRRQTRHSKENPDHRQFALTEIPKVGWNTSWLMKKQELTKQVPETIKRHESLSNSERQASIKKTHPLLHSSLISGPELKEQPSETMVFRGERCEGHEEESVNQNPTVNSSCTEEHNAFTAETGGDRVSEGKGNLEEIADILLMLKHKNKHP
ncbi:uncharacterized protein LOC132859135 [Tachysurus vachellii]|uniref:uncharacterized protein LOC132859135 n=1 Tax=Tachysurus vachellii TaxID=175792 RepID=UPI00296B20B4|nr:uncharacterized protein LOC132859135 [Tachysurus vachellii]